MEKINYIELMFSDFSMCRIDKKNLIEFDCVITSEEIDDSLEYGLANVPIVKKMTIGINNYFDIITYDDPKFDIYRKDISQVIIHYKNENMVMAYVNLDEKNEKDNPNQINEIVRDKELYIYIE